MARKSKVAATTESPAAEIIEAVADSTRMPDDGTSFDPAELEKQAPQEQKRQYQPDPHPYQQISLSGSNDGPKMRLWRNNRKAELAITFDEKPDPQHLQTLKDAGFRWQGDAWVHPMGQDQKWRAVADAEKVFNQIGDAIREERGLPTGQSVA